MLATLLEIIAAPFTFVGFPGVFNSRAVELPASDLLLLATPIHLLKRPGLYPIGGPNRAIKPILCIHCLDCLLCILNFAGATISLTAVLPLFSSVELIPVCLPVHDLP